jgi:hypothetical protein
MLFTTQRRSDVHRMGRHRTWDVVFEPDEAAANRPWRW